MRQLIIFVVAVFSLLASVVGIALYVGAALDTISQGFNNSYGNDDHDFII